MQKLAYIIIGLAAGLSLFLLGPIFSNSLLEAVKTLALIAVLLLFIFFVVYVFNQSRIEEFRRLTNNFSEKELINAPAKAIPIIFTYGSGILVLGTILSIMTAIALLASVSVGYLQAERLANQNAILERQLPLLLRQSIMNNSNQLQSLNQRIRHANAALMKLQGIKNGFAETEKLQFPDLCEYVSGEKYSVDSPITSKECEALASKRLRSLDLITESNGDLNYFQRQFVDWFVSYVSKLQEKTKDVLYVSDIEDPSLFQNENSMLDIISFCEFPPDVSSELIGGIYSIKRFETMVDRSYVSSNVSLILVGYKTAIEELFPSRQNGYALSSLNGRLRKQYTGLYSIVSNAETYCSERVSILTNEKFLLEEALRQDSEDLEKIQNGKSFEKPK